jgi:hypothetical protein
LYEDTGRLYILEAKAHAGAFALQSRFRHFHDRIAPYCMAKKKNKDQPVEIQVRIDGLEHTAMPGNRSAEVFFLAVLLGYAWSRTRQQFMRL